MPLSRTGLFAALLACLLAGCVKENLDDCPAEGGYGLVFYYPGNGTTDIFREKIGSVDVYFYDMDGREVLARVLSEAELDRYQGIVPELADGTYTVVCWGNVDGYSSFTTTDPLTDARLYQRQYFAGDTITDFDPLYFGRRTVTIESRREATDTVMFVSAHINMEVHIGDYTGVISAGDTGKGIISLTNVAVGYDFAMDTTGESSVIYPQWTREPSTGEIEAMFDLLRFGNDNPIELQIRDLDEGEVIATVGLAQFLADNGINVEGVNEITVPIYILFDESDGFYVSVDPWDTAGVEPVPRK